MLMGDGRDRRQTDRWHIAVTVTVRVSHGRASVITTTPQTPPVISRAHQTSINQFINIILTAVDHRLLIATHWSHLTLTLGSLLTTVYSLIVLIKSAIYCLYTAGVETRAASALNSHSGEINLWHLENFQKSSSQIIRQNIDTFDKSLWSDYFCVAEVTCE